MITPNRHYSLPNKNHDVVDDINSLSSTFVLIDDDVKNTEEAIGELSDKVENLKSTVVHASFSVENSEIQNIAPNRYVVVNANGDGFECLEGGGDSGGKIGQCSIKKTDANFDTAWGDILETSKNGMTTLQNTAEGVLNETHIFCDVCEIENDKQLPKVELTNYRSMSDIGLENNSSVILCDEIEESTEEIQTATTNNFGLVKIGSGINNDNGTISTPEIVKADTETRGIIKAGEGLENENGIISKTEINPATFSEYGVVKLGENLSINQNGEMEIGDMASNATIYNLGNVKICSNGIVDLEEQSLRYRVFVTEDLVIQFKANFEPQEDFSFVLEIVSDGFHIISFNENLNPKMSLLPINRGMTKIYVTKKIGVPYYDVKVSRLDAPEPTLLTPNFGDDINSDLCVTHNGCDWNAHDMLKTNTDNINFSGREFYFEFNTLVVVDYVYFFSRYTDQALDDFYLKGSNDKQNWTMLFYKNGEVVNGKIYTEQKGCFRYFKLYIGWKNDNYPRAMQLWGTQIDNNESELILLTPKMASDTTGFAKLTYSNLDEGSAGDLTDASASTSIYVKYSTDTSDLFRWIKYEFPEAVIANFLDVAAHKDNLNRTMRWYKLEGCNDDENWTLLLERQYQRDFYQYETRWHEFANTTAYKFYKLTCLATNGDQYWRIARFRLFRRDIGKWNFIRGVPKLSAANQDGYEVTASSEYNSGHAAYRVFDGSDDTQWASSGTGEQWLQIQLPSATICNSCEIAARSDGYLNQVPKDFKIQGSYDGETWNDLAEFEGITWSSTGEKQSFDFSNETAYSYYRLLITANNGGNDYSLSQWNIGLKNRNLKDGSINMITLFRK